MKQTQLKYLLQELEAATGKRVSAIGVAADIAATRDVDTARKQLFSFFDGLNNTIEQLRRDIDTQRNNNRVLAAKLKEAETAVSSLQMMQAARVNPVNYKPFRRGMPGIPGATLEMMLMQGGRWAECRYVGAQPNDPDLEVVLCDAPQGLTVTESRLLRWRLPG
jgi:uncharacterized coiled-coil protein SlyX